MTKLTKVSTKFSTAERRNWGYWDGKAAQESGRLPEWNHGPSYRCKHPFDQMYGEAFWQGFYGEYHPNTGEITP